MIFYTSKYKIPWYVNIVINIEKALLIQYRLLFHLFLFPAMLFVPSFGLCSTKNMLIIFLTAVYFCGGSFQFYSILLNTSNVSENAILTS